MSTRLSLSILLVVSAGSLLAGDIPFEVQTPRELFPAACAPPVLGAPGAITLQSGLGSLMVTDTSGAGTLAQPWAIALGVTGPLTLQLQGEVPGGPLRNFTNFNATGSPHVAGRWFAVDLMNNSGSPWTGVDLSVSAPAIASLGDAFWSAQLHKFGVENGLALDLDGVSFGDGSTVLSNASSDLLPLITGDGLHDVLSFSGGVVAPGQLVHLILPLTDDGYGPNRGPYFSYELDVNPVGIAPTVTPEPGTLVLLGGAFIGLFAVSVRKRHLFHKRLES